MNDRPRRPRGTSGQPSRPPASRPRHQPSSAEGEGHTFPSSAGTPRSPRTASRPGKDPQPGPSDAAKPDTAASAESQSQSGNRPKPPRKGSGKPNGKSNGGATSKVGRAARVAADRYGGSGTSELLSRGSSSDGTAKGDAKAVGSGVKAGAQLGSKIGGPAGTAIGAIGGGALAAAKNKRTRRLMIAGVVTSVLAPFIAMGLVTLLLVMMVTGGSPQGSDSNAINDEKATEAVLADGLDPDGLAVVREVASEKSLPWEILAAIIENADGELESQGAGEDPADQFKEAMKSDDPYGPYGLDLKKARKMQKAPILGTTMYAVDTDGYSSWTDRAMATTDLRAGSEYVADLLSNLLRLNDELDGYGLDAGTISTEFDAYTTGLTYESGGSGNDPAQAPAPDDGGLVREDDLTSEAQTTRDAYIGALEKMPIENHDDAEEIFELAMRWHFGQQQPCETNTEVTPATSVVAGAWSNPVVGRLSSPYGMRVHPITGIYKLHDGQDISASMGATVHAAGAGTVQVLDESWSGSNNLVTIEHGNGVVTLYGHMSKVLVASGDQVNAGDPVGQVGAEGYSTGPHLHFMVRLDGETTDPLAFLKEKGVALGSDDPAKVVGDGSSSTGTVSVGLNQVPSPSTPQGATSTVLGATGLVALNLPGRMSAGAFSGALSDTAKRNPDFITLNEVGSRSTKAVTAATGGRYDAYRDPRRDATPGGEQSMNNMVAWRKDTWTRTDGGRVKIVDDDYGYLNGKKFRWDRYATWVMLRRDSDGAVVSVISTHLPTNPYKAPRQWGKPSGSRAALYGAGVDALAGLADSLSSHGAVLVGGDMNTRPDDGPNAAAPKMSAAGYGHAKDDGMMYVFYKESAGASLAASQRFGIPGSDHPGLFARVAMSSDSAAATSGTLPDSWSGTAATGEKVTLDRTQLEYAAAIAQKGSEMGVDDNGIIIAFMTVFTESRFKNYASDVYPETMGKQYPDSAVGSDHDSVGLFQQRPQSGWGSPLELLDPAYTASAFFGGPQGPNGGSPMGLLDHTGWENMAKGVAAQDVQVSAHPDRYTAWETPSTELLGIVKGITTTPVLDDPECPAAASGTAFSGSQFTIASFNMLGDSHTRPGGNKKGWPQSSTRTPAALNVLTEAGVSVAGLQEFEAIQWKQVKAAGGTWDLFPQQPKNTANSILWDSTQWSFVSGRQFSIPYFYGRPAPQSYARLKSISSGEEIYVISVHNPANVAGQAQGYRNKALQIEKELVAKLSESGIPVFIVGDFNEVDNTHCTFVPDMTAAYGQGASSPCRAPKGAGIDQIFVTGDTQFSSVKVDSSLKGKGITDHPIVYAGVGSSETAGANGKVSTAMAYAMAQVGKGYSQATPPGRLGPTHYDCSGLMFMAWKQAGISIPMVSITQSAYGTKVPLSQIQPGDMIFYYSPVGHVSMYIGKRNGVPSVVHAANPRSGVEVSPMSEMAGDITVVRRVWDR